jgi:uncharacterized protein YndB with AHSA1/START domain
VTWMIESARDAAVAPADVFRLYADPSTWSEWGHNAKWARADGPLVEGGTVDVKAGYGKVYPSRIRRLVAGRALVLEVRPPLMTVINTYEVEPTADGAHIRHALEVSGPRSRSWRDVPGLSQDGLGFGDPPADRGSSLTVAMKASNNARASSALADSRASNRVKR